MNFDDRVKAVSDLGFTERQARFLVTAMLYAGVCVPRQYATFSGTAYGHTVSRFFDKLVRRGYATACGCLHNRAEVYHLQHPALYRAIDQPHSRYRRPVPARQVIDRLLRLDAIVLQPDLIWLVTEEEKVAFVSLMAPSFTRERLPHGMVGEGTAQRLWLFPDDQPMGVTTRRFGPLSSGTSTCSGRSLAGRSAWCFLPSSPLTGRGSRAWCVTS